MDIVNAFLHRHRMSPTSVSYDWLTQELFLQMSRGLAGGDTSIPMLPSYVYAEGAPKRDTPAAVIDAGGTNFRRALVTLTDDGVVVEDIAVHPMPGTDREATWAEFIACCADAVEPLLSRTNRIGVCFSYSFTPTPDGDGRVMQITKEVRIAGASGRPICADLAAELAKRGHTDLRLALINDTLAVHLGVAAGLGLPPAECMGMVCGTGSNVCCAVETKRITKLTAPDRGAMLINTESGFFTGVRQGDFDRALDASTADPGHALSEKMVSGAYLGELCRLTLRGAAREGLFSKAGAKRILAMDALTSYEADTLSGPLEALSKKDKATADKLIGAIFDRSAKTMCCTLSAVLRLTGKGTDSVFHIGAEGSLFQKSRRFRPALERHMDAYARRCLVRQFDFCTCENTTLLGAACAALLCGDFMTIRPILPTDDPMAVSRVYEESWKTAYRGILPDEYLDSIPAGQWANDRPSFRTLLLLDGADIVGVSTVCRSRFPDWPDWGEVVSLYLRPAYMDKGHGGPLLEAAVDTLRQQGFDRVFLWVLEENARARHFYEKHGFHPSGAAIETEIGGKTVREVRYCRA